MGNEQPQAADERPIATFHLSAGDFPEQGGVVFTIYARRDRKGTHVRVMRASGFTCERTFDYAADAMAWVIVQTGWDDAGQYVGDHDQGEWMDMDWAEGRP